MINITESFCFENQAKFSCGVLVATSQTKVVISNTNISQNSGMYYAMWLDNNSVLELYGSPVEDNKAQSAGALYISDSLFVAANSSFKRNSAYEESTITVINGTVYLENCTFFENRLTYGGTITAGYGGTLKVSDTVFTQNEGYDISLNVDKEYFTKFEIYRFLFVHNNISLKSNAKKFDEVAVKEKVIGLFPFFNQNLLNQKKHRMPQVRYFIFSYCKMLPYFGNQRRTLM